MKDKQINFTYRSDFTTSFPTEPFQPVVKTKWLLPFWKGFPDCKMYMGTPVPLDFLELFQS